MLESVADPKFWRRAIELLNVTRMDQHDDPLFGELKYALAVSLKTVLANVPTTKVSEPASFSVARAGSISTVAFTRFSVPGPLMSIIRSQRQKSNLETATGNTLDLVLNCPVTRLKCSQNEGVVDIIETEKGSLTLPGSKTKLILCAGVSEAARYSLVLRESKELTPGEGYTKRNTTFEFL